MEIERKFLVREFPSAVNNCDFDIISQGYLSFSPEVRVRSRNSLYYLTVKGEGDLARPEYEIEISLNAFLELSNCIQGSVIQKNRYLIPIDHYMAELDVFSSPATGLSTVEVEFESEEAADAFIAPWWFGVEVTSDPDFKNKNIARRS